MVAQFAATQMAVASSYVSQVPTANSSSPYCSGRISQQFIRFHWLKYKPSRAFSVRASAHSADDSVVTLLDYGAGNVRSVRNTILFLGFDIKDVRTPEDILNAKRLIFPGVGAFAPAMDVLNKKGCASMLHS